MTNFVLNKAWLEQALLQQGQVLFLFLRLSTKFILQFAELQNMEQCLTNFVPIIHQNK